MLELPPTSSGVVGAAAPTQKLAELYVDDPKDCELEIVGVKEVFGQQTKVTLEPPATAPSGTLREWQVRRVMLDPLTRTPMKNSKMLATIHLDKSDLSFRWESEMAQGDNAATNRADLLKACLLKVRVDDRTEYCTLLKSPLGVAEPIQLVGSESGAKTNSLKLSGNTSSESTPKGPPPGVRIVKFSNDQPSITCPLLDPNAPGLPFKNMPANLQITLLPPRSADPSLKFELASSPTSSQISVNVDEGHGFKIDLEILSPGTSASENPSPTLKVSVNFDQITFVPGTDSLKWEPKEFSKRNFDLTWERVQKRFERKKSEIEEIDRKYKFDIEQLDGRAKVNYDNKLFDESTRLKEEANKLRETQRNDKKLNLAKEQRNEAEVLLKYLEDVERSMRQFQKSVVIGFRLSLAHKEREIILIEADPSPVKIDPPPAKSDSKPKDKRDKNPE